MSQGANCNVVLDTIIKQAAEQDKLGGLMLLVPESATTSLVSAVVEGKSISGTLMTYKGVKLQTCDRIKSFDLVEAVYETK